MKTLTKLMIVLTVLISAAFGQHGTASALGGPVFDYPIDGQTLDFEGSYLFRVQPIASAQGYLWGFFQNGVMVWENWRDEGALSDNEYGIHPGTVAHTKFALGAVDVWVRASIDGQWTDATVITIYLQPRATSSDLTIEVPGSANIWLAGMPDGTLSLFGDSAPMNSPAQVQELPLSSGTSLSFSATGVVSHGPAGDPSIETSGPDGGANILSHDFGPENGISDVSAPINALMGVFLGSDRPDLLIPPDPLDFSTMAGQDFLVLSPRLQQVFFIGDGMTNGGQRQIFIIPEGTTRLFLGPMDASQYYNNEGSFTVQVSVNQPVEVAVDVKPGRFPNRIKLEENVCRDDDHVYVAVLTTSSFDAETLDVSTLEFGDPKLDKTVKPERSRVRDVDLDGDKDLMLIFNLCNLITNQALNKNTTELVLTAKTLDGMSITGRDSVKVILATGQGGWISTGSLTSPSRDHVATLMDDGRVLIIGGTGGGTLAQLFDPVDGVIHPAGNTLFCHQQGATVTRLSGGKVLILGGGGCGLPTGAELYDPRAGTFNLTGSLSIPDLSHQAAVLLPDGKVLIAGGQSVVSDQSLASAELFDPVTGIFTPTGSMSTDRVQPSATLLSDGRVLIAGGTRITSPGYSICLNSSEIYNPDTETFSPIANMHRARCGTQGILLANGKVLMVGGDAFDPYSAELFDPAAQTFIQTGNMITDRDVPSATLLSDGRVLVTGGIGFIGDVPVTLASAEIYDPESNSFTPIADMDQARAQHTATLLKTGQVLVTGGFDLATHSDLNSAELFSGSPATVSVAIDIKPGRFPNRIKLEENVCRDDDHVYVAVLTTSSFDAETLDVSTLEFGDPNLGQTVKPERSRVRDVDLDGGKDLMLVFNLCNLITNNALNKNTTELVLTGRTLDGIEIAGRDSVKVVVDEKHDNKDSDNDRDD